MGFVGWERGQKGDPKQNLHWICRFRAWGFHAAVSLPDLTFAFHLRERGVLLELATPTPGSCRLKVEARFVQLSGPEPLLRRRLPPPRPALVEVVVSLPFFSSALSPTSFLNRNAVRTAGAVGEEREPRD